MMNTKAKEIGMVNIRMDKLEDYRDVEVYGKYNDLVKTGLMSHEEFMEGAYKEARDNNRLPIQWDSSKNAGFTSGDETWIKVHPNYQVINAENEVNNPNSIFSYYKKLLNLRKHSEYASILVYGKFDAHVQDHNEVFVYTRSDEKHTIAVVSNMVNRNTYVELPFEIEKVLLQNYNKDYVSNKLELEPYETLVFVVKR